MVLFQELYAKSLNVIIHRFGSSEKQVPQIWLLPQHMEKIENVVSKTPAFIDFVNL